MTLPSLLPRLAVQARLVAFLGLTAVSTAGCTTRYIPNTDVEDTDENRDVVKFCETYRRAIERKDIGLLLSLASPRYYEDGGNVDPADDLDYEGLREWLEGRFQDTRAIRYEIRYRRVVKGDQNKVHVVYTYSASYKIPGLKTEDRKSVV